MEHVRKLLISLRFHSSAILKIASFDTVVDRSVISNSTSNFRRLDSVTFESLVQDAAR